MLATNNPPPIPTPETDKTANFKHRRVQVGRSYGYFVSLLKLVLPTVALVLIVSVILWPMLNDQEKRFNVNITKADRESAQNMLVFNATYSGMMGDNSQFTITAEKTEQTSPNDNLVDLIRPKGDILDKNGSWYAVTANMGRLNREAGTLELWDDVNAFQDSGMELLTDNVVIDLESNSGYGLDPLQGQGPMGYVEAEGFRLYNGGARIELLGQSKVIIYDNEKPS